jgi:GNAT superfamily N-acetyltransferase
LDFEQTFDEAAWRQRLSSPSVVAFDEHDDPVACGAVFPKPPDRAVVVAMWVEPSHRGRGLSRMVLDVLVGWARERGLAIEIGVNTANPGARAAYEAYGFVPTGHRYPLRDGSEQRCESLELPATPG